MHVCGGCVRSSLIKWACAVESYCIDVKYCVGVWIPILSLQCQDACRLSLVYSFCTFMLCGVFCFVWLGSRASLHASDVDIVLVLQFKCRSLKAQHLHGGRWCVIACVIERISLLLQLLCLLHHNNQLVIHSSWPLPFVFDCALTACIACRLNVECVRLYRTDCISVTRRVMA